MFRFKRAFWMTALPGIVGLAAQTPAWAQSAQAQPSAEALQAARAACGTDLQQYCAGVKPGGGRILACLKEHREQVSPGCKQAVQAALQGPGGGTGGAAAAAATSPAPAAAATAAAAAAPVAPVAAAADASPASQAAPAPASGAPAMTKTVAHADGGAPHYFKLKRMKAALKDGDQEKMGVFTLLAPEDWTLAGGFTNKPNPGTCFSDMNQVQGTVKAADGTHGMAVVARQTFRWADDPQVRNKMAQRDRMDKKYKLDDCPTRAPMHAADFLREFEVWNIHKDKPQVTAEPFPELERLVRMEQGLGPKNDASARVEAVRVRASATDRNGQPIDEWWSAAIVVRTFPVAGRGLGYDWHAEQVTFFQAPKGELDGYDKLYRVMATSIRPDPQFQTFNNDMVGKLSAARAEAIRQQDDIIAKFQQHVADVIQGVTENQQNGALQSAYGFDQGVRGVQTFHDPASGRNVELSNLYDHAWSNGNDQYIVTDDPNFNPNGHVNGDWGELQPVRPQP